MVKRVFRRATHGGFSLALLLLLNPVAAEESPSFGGPDTVERLIESDRTRQPGLIETEIFQPVERWQKRMESEHGFSIAADYSAVTVHASDSLADTDDSASGGMLRIYGRWKLTGDGVENSGALVYKVEHRHSYGDPAPSSFYLGNVGYAGLTAPPFSDQEERFTNLYWRQSMNSGRTVVLGGFLDVTDFVDVYGLASPWLHFMNLVFNCRLALTDSGGIQEESSYLGIPCLTLRPNTERPITITAGTNRLCTVESFEKDVETILAEPRKHNSKIDLWDGKTAGRVVESIKKFFRIK